MLLFLYTNICTHSVLVLIIPLAFNLRFIRTSIPGYICFSCPRRLLTLFAINWKTGFDIKICLIRSLYYCMKLAISCPVVYCEHLEVSPLSSIFTIIVPELEPNYWPIHSRSLPETPSYIQIRKIGIEFILSATTPP